MERTDDQSACPDPSLPISSLLQDISTARTTTELSSPLQRSNLELLHPALVPTANDTGGYPNDLHIVTEAPSSISSAAPSRQVPVNSASFLSSHESTEAVDEELHLSAHMKRPLRPITVERAPIIRTIGSSVVPARMDSRCSASPAMPTERLRSFPMAAAFPLATASRQHTSATSDNNVLEYGGAGPIRALTRSERLKCTATSSSTAQPCLLAAPQNSDSELDPSLDAFMMECLAYRLHKQQASRPAMGTDVGSEGRASRAANVTSTIATSESAVAINRSPLATPSNPPTCTSAENPTIEALSSSTRPMPPLGAPPLVRPFLCSNLGSIGPLEGDFAALAAGTTVVSVLSERKTAVPASMTPRRRNRASELPMYAFLRSQRRALSQTHRTDDKIHAEEAGDLENDQTQLLEAVLQQLRIKETVLHQLESACQERVVEVFTRRLHKCLIGFHETVHQTAAITGSHPGMLPHVHAAVVSSLSAHIARASDEEVARSFQFSDLPVGSFTATPRQQRTEAPNRSARVPHTGPTHTGIAALQAGPQARLSDVYSKLFLGSTVSRIIFAARDMSIVDANELASRNYGRSRDDLLASHLKGNQIAVAHTSVLPLLLDMFALVMQGHAVEALNFPCYKGGRFVITDGRWFPTFQKNALGVDVPYYLERIEFRCREYEHVFQECAGNVPACTVEILSVHSPPAP